LASGPSRVPDFSRLGWASKITENIAIALRLPMLVP
jgi:hypothetical protein